MSAMLTPSILPTSTLLSKSPSAVPVMIIPINMPPDAPKMFRRCFATIPPNELLVYFNRLAVFYL